MYTHTYTSWQGHRLSNFLGEGGTRPESGGYLCMPMHICPRNCSLSWSPSHHSQPPPLSHTQAQQWLFRSEQLLWVDTGQVCSLLKRVNTTCFHLQQLLGSMTMAGSDQFFKVSVENSVLFYTLTEFLQNYMGVITCLQEGVGS